MNLIGRAWLSSIGLIVLPLAEPRRFKFDPSHIESVDQMLLGAKIAQNSLAPVAEEDMDDAEQQPVYSEKVDKTLERYDSILIRVLYNQGNPLQSVEILVT